MTGPEYAELQHQSPCPNCGIRLMVSMSRCRLERMPWRLEWNCEACSRKVRVRLDKRLVPMVLDLDRPGGTWISFREIRDFLIGLDEIEAHVAEELFFA